MKTDPTNPAAHAVDPRAQLKRLIAALIEKRANFQNIADHLVKAEQTPMIAGMQTLASQHAQGMDLVIEWARDLERALPPFAAQQPSEAVRGLCRAGTDALDWLELPNASREERDIAKRLRSALASVDAEGGR